MNNYDRRAPRRREYGDNRSEYSSDASSHGRPVRSPSPPRGPKRGRDYSRGLNPSYVPACDPRSGSNYRREFDDASRSERDYYKRPQRQSQREDRTERADSVRSSSDRFRGPRRRSKYEASGETYVGGGGYSYNDNPRASRELVRYGDSYPQDIDRLSADGEISEYSSTSSSSTAGYGPVGRMNDRSMHGHRQFDDVREYYMEMRRPPGDVRRPSVLSVTHFG